ncbi:MAG: hypothetical protein H6659_06995 [Ardenticatenaceae bacterium]|nr:hypothetical protein [Ardenticatenaceae bacterium]
MLYQIMVPGMLDENWSDWATGLSITTTNERDSQPVTVLTGEMDQAALHGLLRRLYGLGLPLLAVRCVASN